MDHAHDREHGDRDAFLAPLRRHLAGVAPVAAPDPVPAPVDTTVPDDLLTAFVAAATAAGAEVVTTEGPDVSDDVLDRWLGEHAVERAVASAAPEARAVAAALRRRGIAVEAAAPAAAAAADLGVTSADALVAATGSLVVRSDGDGRLASLLPPVHLCVAPAHRLVATPGAVLRGLGAGPPPGLVLITGTSRTGDIEQILTRRVHGPGTVLIVVTETGR
jgi:L-lactate utilization protein LutC